MSLALLPTTGASGYTGTSYLAEIADWATLRATALQAVTTTQSGMVRLNAPGYKSLWRMFLMFDARVLNAQEIISATLKFTISINRNETTRHNYYIVPTNPASPSGSLITADHSTVTMTNYGSLDFNGLTGAQEIALNASGIASISLSGITKLGLMGEWDYANIDPGAGNAAEDLTITSVGLEITYKSRGGGILAML